MKSINRIFLFFSLIFILVIFSSVFAYADSIYENEEIFEIKSGIDLTKSLTTTFDKTRTITGISEAGNQINISVYQKVSSTEQLDKNYIEVYNYLLTVGASGYFSQNIDLIVGDNIVVISAIKDEQVYSISTIIRRKNSEIKSELEKIIILPISRS